MDMLERSLRRCGSAGPLAFAVPSVISLAGNRASCGAGGPLSLMSPRSWRADRSLRCQEKPEGPHGFCRHWASGQNPQYVGRRAAKFRAREDWAAHLLRARSAYVSVDPHRYAGAMLASPPPAFAVPTVFSVSGNRASCGPQSNLFYIRSSARCDGVARFLARAAEIILARANFRGAWAVRPLRERSADLLIPLNEMPDVELSLRQSYTCPKVYYGSLGTQQVPMRALSGRCSRRRGN